jgi:class 3 adenylate cyclase
MAPVKSGEPLTPVTVHFVDISGSTTLYAERGDAEAYELTRTCLDTVVAAVRAAGGRVLRHVGDGVLSIYDRAEDALRAAIAIGEAVEDPRGRLAREGLHVRSGINTGRAVMVDGDVYGDVANVAARLVGRAGAGEIFFSGATCDALPPDLCAAAQPIGALALRNRPQAVLVYKYAADSHLATMNIPPPALASRATMELTCGAQRVMVGPARSRVRIGRDPAADICIDDDAVSRRHAEITSDHDRFTLIDRSTNGTCVCADGGSVLRILREDLVLTGSGRILVGQDERVPPIVYRVVVSDLE